MCTRGRLGVLLPPTSLWTISTCKIRSVCVSRYVNICKYTKMHIQIKRKPVYMFSRGSAVLSIGTQTKILLQNPIRLELSPGLLGVISGEAHISSDLLKFFFVHFFMF